MPKISVIVPVYNVEDKISRCLNSLLNQSFNDFELILINDGSQDKSGIICDEYAQKSENITVIHQKNSGVSSARNKGIKLAKGEYITFVDSDDYVHEDYLSTLYEQIEKKQSDIAMCNFFQVNEDGNNELSSHGYDNGIIFNRLEIENIFYSHIILCDKTIGYFSLWNKLFRKNFIIENKIFLYEDMSFGEDMLFVMNCLKYCRSIVFVDTALYYYIQSSSGLFLRYNSNFLSDAMRCYQEVTKQMEPYFVNGKDKKNLNFKYWYYILRYVHGVIENEKYINKKIKYVLNNITVKQIIKELNLLDNATLEDNGISRSEKRIFNLINHNLIWLATKYMRYLFDENCFLRRFRKIIFIINTVLNNKYCDKIKSLYWSLKANNIFIIAPKTKIIISKNAKICIKGSLYMNLCWNGKQNQHATLYLGNNAEFIVNGDFRIYSGSYITVEDNAKLILGSGFINNNGKVSCFDKITIGFNVKISEDVAIRDSDNHIITRENYKKQSPIIIGDHVWVGMRSTILKGVTIGSGAVIAAGTIVTKSILPHQLWGGAKSQMIKEYIKWE